MEKKPFKKGVSLEMTEEEYALWLEIVKLEGTNSRNVLRRGIRDRARAVGLELPQGAFGEREKGNWLPKPAALVTLNQQSCGQSKAAAMCEIAAVSI